MKRDLRREKSPLKVCVWLPSFEWKIEANFSRYSPPSSFPTFNCLGGFPLSFLFSLYFLCQIWHEMEGGNIKKQYFSLPWICRHLICQMVRGETATLAKVSTINPQSGQQVQTKDRLKRPKLNSFLHPVGPLIIRRWRDHKKIFGNLLFFFSPVLITMHVGLKDRPNVVMGLFVHTD